MDNTKAIILIMALSLLVASFILLWYMLLQYTKYRQMTLQFTSLKNLHQKDNQSRVLIKGHALRGSDGILRAPLSRENCVWYRHRITRRKRGDVYLARTTLEDKVLGGDFYIDDKGYRVKVIGDSALLEIHSPLAASAYRKRQKMFFKGLDKLSFHEIFNDPLQKEYLLYKDEWIIKENEEVIVNGILTRLPSGEEIIHADLANKNDLFISNQPFSKLRKIILARIVFSTVGFAVAFSVSFPLLIFILKTL